MMREAAALTALASSTLGGKKGAVVTYLENAGRLTMIDTKEDIY
ncbi:MAG: hypothetical protein ACR2MX_07670 [Cyclobacteriaceae bacterium]